MKVKQMDRLERESMNDSFLFCRTVLHAWAETPANDVEKPGDGWLFALQCTRCLTRRIDVISHKTGELVRRRYDYPDGYELDEKLTRSEVRIEIARRRDYDFLGLTERKKTTLNKRKAKQLAKKTGSSRRKAS